jgi:hypothetical protein
MSVHNRRRRAERRQQRQQARQLNGPLTPEAVAAWGLEMMAAGVVRPGQLYSQGIYHDSWCDLLNDRGPCNCEPILGVPEQIVLPDPEAN